jgi:hypothetical protein
MTRLIHLDIIILLTRDIVSAKSCVRELVGTIGYHDDIIVIRPRIFQLGNLRLQGYKATRP